MNGYSRMRFQSKGSGEQVQQECQFPALALDCYKFTLRRSRLGLSSGLWPLYVAGRILMRYILTNVCYVLFIVELKHSKKVNIKNISGHEGRKN